MKRLPILALAIGGLLPLPAPSAAGAERPIVYVVVIDGLERDRVEAEGMPFVSSLLGGEGASATYYSESRSVIPAETNPNHTAMMTGAFPGSSGIAANAFALYASLENEDSCKATGPFDYTAFPTETSGENANCPQAQMVFEAIKRQGNPDRLATAGVFGKPKLGRIFAGRKLNPQRRDIDYLWAPCSSGADDDEYCGDVPTNPISGYAMDDDTVMDAVFETIDDGIPTSGGGSRRPDLTFVNLHQVDSAGHAAGTGPIYDAAIGMADVEVEELVARLRQRGEWRRTVLILLSDHGMDTTPQRISVTGLFTDGGIGEDQFLAVDNGSIDLIYLANRGSPERFALLKRMREIALAESGVDEALYRQPNPQDGGAAHTIEAVHPDWNAGGVRSGDLLITSKPGATFTDPSITSNPLPGNHGGPQTQDNFLAVISGGPLVRQGIVFGSGRARRPVNVDIAPTLMGLFGLFPPADNAGRFLASAFDRAELKRVSRPRPPLLSPTRGAHPRARASEVAFLNLRPTGGRYDLQVRRAGRWKPLLRRSKRSSVRFRGVDGHRYRFRARAYSAAEIASRWRKTSVRF